jgi:tetratricopeptide (TPR) repeat protein
VSRTSKCKIQYFVILVVLGAAVCVSLLWFRAPLWGWVAAALVCMIPGRVVGHYYRDLFTGRRLMDARRFAEAIPHFERFLERIRARPALKRLICLSPGIYTRDVEAMTLNNLGIARLEVGELDRVEAPLRRALALDPDYPLPYVNLAHLASLHGDVEAAAAASRSAKRLGYHDTRADAFIRRASGTLASLESGSN